MALLIPREHGAYGQLLMPLVVAFVVGGAGAGQISLAAASIAAFLAHEPLLVLLGQRGGRASREQSSAARRSLLLLGLLAIVAGGFAVALLPTRARIALAIPISLAMIAAVLVASGRERTTQGEVLIALTLTSVSFPVMMAGDVSVQAAATVSAVFTEVFASATLAVRAVIAHATKSAHGARRLAAAVVVVLVSALGVLTAYEVVVPVAIWAAAPAWLLALVLLASMPAPRHLRRVGWTIVGVTAVAAIVLMAALR